MLRELQAAILPAAGLAKTLSDWQKIAKLLTPTKRSRKQQKLP